MNHSEFGHTLRRICPRKPGRRATNPVSGRHTARHDMPPHPSVELLWNGPGLGAADDDEGA
ncbi:hypothetical protein [Mycobacterium sp. 852002-40037_SCH5390672]|uniref:hypothetical protein n=1 Tax=Mycobacterium sp. 852002-40037_SCH5390672 TaxID=1834089 RepID=UPI00080515EB|nr:hypothetical protein [Mycobacterium sp. 852002-40037_SCH5390672]OBB95553.1 hypothetical protein A5782_06320 [Mycobacterium sp. 852002-40037_SCH5390672]